MATRSAASTGFKLPLAYRLFFLTIEPLATLAGAYLAHFQQHHYLSLTHAPSSPSSPSATNTADAMPLVTGIVLTQLANMYLVFALNEAFVLRCTSDLRVWRTLLLGLLIADIGHLYSVSPLGLEVYWRVARWNAMDWGNVGFVYAGALMRIAFLSGVGLPEKSASPAKTGKSRRAA
ncbi:MAG: hypothetical protein M1832_003212 [Thelocarpon impressellum]|nr:MAG: hypothetical protein M1832_003212 [Thelocarpon impressellum]